MILDFSKIEETVIPQFYGGEKEIRAHMNIDKNNKILLGTLEPGASIGLHTHETNSEIIYILSGKGKVLFEGEYELVSAGLCHYCPQGCSHSLINDSDDNLTFFADMSSPRWCASASAGILPSGNRRCRTLWASLLGYGPGGTAHAFPSGSPAPPGAVPP